MPGEDKAWTTNNKSVDPRLREDDKKEDDDNKSKSRLECPLGFRPFISRNRQKSENLFFTRRGAVFVEIAYQICDIENIAGARTVAVSPVRRYRRRAAQIEEWNQKGDIKNIMLAAAVGITRQWLPDR